MIERGGGVSTTKTKYIYHPRTSTPELNNPYYNKTDNGGYSTAIFGNYPPSSDNKTGLPGLTVLPNCSGYAYGRFNEIVGQNKMVYLSPANGGDFMKYAAPCKTGWEPKLGACMVWAEDGSYGHVAIVERINDDGSILTSESGWNYSPAFQTFKGFIYNPAVPDDASPGTAVKGIDYGPPPAFLTIDNNNLDNSLNSLSGSALFEVEYTTEKRNVTTTTINTVNYNGVLNQTKSTGLLTFPTRVETPFIIVKIGNYTFGNYNVISSANQIRVTYPNFIKGMEVTKINGRLNQYTIQIVYQIQHGDDPNLLDKIFSSVGYSTIKITYGDWSAPNLIYKEEEALITKLTSNVDFTNARITYTLNCTSSALGLISSSFPFEGGYIKPSDEIKRILFDPKYGLSQVFTGMKTLTQVNSNGWIASNDKIVKVEAKDNIDPLSYINYLVSCMVCETNSDDDVLLDSRYYLTLVDNTYGSQAGTYFTVKQMYSNSKTIHNQDVYEVDIGFPSDELVMSFNLRDDNSWSLLYHYNESIQQKDYTYDIDDKGNVVTNYSPAYSTSAINYITTPAQKNWWTQMTKFPITATLVIKGLIRPAMLMSYVKVNAFFYGQRHIASGIYFVIKQVDKINGNGYRTELTLTRFAGDEDYIRTTTEERDVQVAKVVSKGTAGAGDSIENSSVIATDKVSIKPKKQVGYSGGGREVTGYVV